MKSVLNEKRIIVDEGIAARIAAIIEPAIEDLGYLLVRVRVTSQNGCTVQIMAEKEDGTMPVTGCAKISRTISPLFEVEDPIETAYHLEISSPGIDRPLVRLSDFEKNLGEEAKIELRESLNHQKRFRGTLSEVKAGQVCLEMPDKDENGDKIIVTLDLANLRSAKLVMTDVLLARAAAAQAGKPTTDEEEI